MKKLLLLLLFIPLVSFGQVKYEGKTLAGVGWAGPAANQLYNPSGIALDADGNMYIADAGNNRIQMWAPGASEGTTVAGGNGAGSVANQLYNPTDITLDASGNLYVSDGYNHRIQKWEPGASEGTTVAGGNGRGSAANQLDIPSGIKFDTDGNLYIADGFNHRIQKWAPGASEGTTVAGGNGQSSAANQLYYPMEIALDASGNIYIVDRSNDRIQKWEPGASEGTTVAGGNGQSSAANQLHTPNGIALDADGNIYISDAGNHRIQKWEPGASEGTTVAGGGWAGSAADQLNGPTDITLDASGSLYIVDRSNDRIQKWEPGLSFSPGNMALDLYNNQTQKWEQRALEDLKSFVERESLKNSFFGAAYHAIDENNIVKMAETIFGIKVFNSGYPENFNGYGSDFGHYNPLFLDKVIELFKSLSPSLKILIQPLYNSYFLFPFRKLMANQISNYFEFRADKNLFISKLESKYDHNIVVTEIKARNSNVPEETLFWIRRNYDGTSDKFLELVNLIMEEFDDGNISTETALTMDGPYALAHIIHNKINEFQSPDEEPLTFDEIFSRISVSESYEDYLYSFSHKKESSPYLYRMYYYPNEWLSGGNDLNKLIKEVYLNGKLIREEVGNTIYTYDSSGNVEEKAYHKNGNLAELFNNDEVFELKLNNGKILKNRKTTETFFDENGNLASKFEFFQGVNYVFYQVCKCCPSFENYTSRSKRRSIDAIMFDWERSDCAEGGPAPVTPVVSTKTAIFYSNGLPKSKEVSLYKSVKNMDNLDEVSYLKEEKLPGYWDWEDIDFPFSVWSSNSGILYDLSTGVSLTVDYNQNQEKSYSVTSAWGKIDLSEIYFVNAKNGLNVRDNNSLDGNKIGGLAYGSLVYIAKENQGELTVNDTDPITGEKKQIEGNWVTVVSMDFKQTFFNENVIGGFAFDGFLTKVKTDSFDYFKFLETENRVHYSELEEGEVYLYKGEKYTGLAISFHDNGQLAFAASYKDGKLNGWWRKWEENGSLFLETEYVDGEMVSEMDFN